LHTKATHHPFSLLPIVEKVKCQKLAEILLFCSKFGRGKIGLGTEPVTVMGEDKSDVV
jgi:hypothetical protein